MGSYHSKTFLKDLKEGLTCDEPTETTPLKQIPLINNKDAS